MIIDYSVARPSPAVLKAHGVTAVGRYIGWDSVPGYPSIGKNLTKAEATALHAAGIAVFVAFEYGAEAVKGGYTQGFADGVLAAAQLATLGAPDGMTVYFAIDFDIPDYAPTSRDPRAKLGPVARYFDGVNAAASASAKAGVAYKVGVYGGFYAVQRVLDARLAVMAWQTVAWSGGNLDPRAVLYQTTRSTGIAGTDFNVHVAAGADFGQWPRPTAPKPPPPAPKPPAPLPEGPPMIIIDVAKTGLPAGTPWPGIFLLMPGALGPVLYHIPDLAEVDAYVAAGIPRRSWTYAQYKAAGGKVMTAYRKKPVVIEAEQLTEDNFYAVGDWASVEQCWDLAAPKPALHIQTLEGTMKAFLGDWVIQGVKGEFYPCKPDVFAATYEAVS